MSIEAERFSAFYGTPLEETQKAMDSIRLGEISFYAVSGKIASGKDSSAMKIAELMGLSEIKNEFFAYPLKTELAEIAGLLKSSDSFEKAVKTVSSYMNVPRKYAENICSVLWPSVENGDEINFYERNPVTRAAHQVWGTECRRILEPNYWVNMTMNRVVSNLSNGENTVLTDSRFPNEEDSLQFLGAFSLRLKVSRETQLKRLKQRGDKTPSIEALNHLSETSLDEYEKDNRFSLVLNTDNLTLDEVAGKAASAYKDFKKEKAIVLV